MKRAAGKERLIVSFAAPSYSFATHFKDWDEKPVGVKVNCLPQKNLWRMDAIWLRRGDCVLLSKCFGLNVSLYHHLATHPYTLCRCFWPVHCSSIHHMIVVCLLFGKRYRGRYYVVFFLFFLFGWIFHQSVAAALSVNCIKAYTVNM